MRLPAILVLLAALFTSAAASARDDLDEAVQPQKREPKVRLPPLRLESRAVFRQEANPGSLFELGVQMRRWKKGAIDANIAYAPHHGLALVGPFRTMGSLETTADALYFLGPFLATGPSAGLSFRFYRQQWSPISEGWMPIAGWRLSTSVVRARRWALLVSAKAMVDLAPTELVLETAEIRKLRPVEGQLGLRINFGHGRVK